MNQWPGLVKDVRQLASTHHRLILGLTGPPASGKTALANHLSTHLAQARVVAMDGFHLDDVILKQRRIRHRKGAPQTFDVAGFVALLQRLRGDDTVFAPVFERDLELSRNAAIEIPPEIKIVIVEGNYLLHDRDGWQHVRPKLDACWYIDAPLKVLQQRLMTRWLDYGYSAARAGEKITKNDLLNARIVSATKPRADRIVPAR
ncbi:MAG: nucleoside/nucleotide kinase family protein [Paracoccaceae bacterium]